MPVVLGDNSISIDGKVIETVKSSGTYDDLSVEPTITTGGTISPVVIDANYKYVMFTNTGANQTSYTVIFPTIKVCNILIIGGGGGGGFDGAGGGGGGQVNYSTNQNFNGTYTINVGRGGNVQENANSPAESGYASSVIQSSTTIFSSGGGAGGGSRNNNGVSALGGGSGGGHGAAYSGGSSTGGGGNGGNSSPPYSGGGGGGGANVANKNGGNGSSSLAGTGGAGINIDITGTSIGYGGGGAGGTYMNVSIVTGTHGGGNGGAQSGVATSGRSGSGGGGGGGGWAAHSAFGKGGIGGSGIVIIRYPRVKLPFDAQWTYNASNANVYYLGNVGIGTANPNYALHVIGNTLSSTYSASSKTFKIEHPLKLNKWLYHGCIEGPRFDNIYRGKKLIVDGKAKVDIDTECNTTGGMTPGTFPTLNTNTQLFLRNNQTYDRVKGKINGSTISIECENTTDEIEIDWMVVGERHDEHVINTPLTDSDGNLICEHDI
jgi:hypothetical protein